MQINTYMVGTIPKDISSASANNNCRIFICNLLNDFRLNFENFFITPFKIFFQHPHFSASSYYFPHIRYLPYKPSYAEAGRQTNDRRQAELHKRSHLQAGQRQSQKNEDRHMDDVHGEGMLREEPSE